MELNSAQIKNREYNLSQTQVGHPLKTLRGSTIKRSKFGVGKLIGGQLYLAHEYIYDVLPQEMIHLADDMAGRIPFDFKCVRWDIKKETLALVESPDFDTAREPVVGRMFVEKGPREYQVTRFFNQVWHHKWLWTLNDYKGFDVAESWEWSKTWLSGLTEPADGSNESNWLRQLERFNLS